MHLSSVDLVRVARRRPPGEAESLRGTINLSRHGMIIGEEHFFVQCTILGEANQLTCLYATDKRSENKKLHGQCYIQTGSRLLMDFNADMTRGRWKYGAEAHGHQKGL